MLQNWTYIGLVCYSFYPGIAYIDITFDTNMSFTAHITTITLSTNQRVNLLFRAFFSQNTNILVKALPTPGMLHFRLNITQLYGRLIKLVTFLV